MGYIGQEYIEKELYVVFCLVVYSIVKNKKSKCGL
jgi:hypothetical protein